ncbi:unnamed protein product, partial [Ectocarpus sp. 12 AP-2014]
VTLIRLILSVLVVVSSVAVAQARTVYVDDQLYLPVRSGPGSQYRIIENAVPSGTALQVLEGENENYTRVRTPKGNDGWVSTQYLSDTPIARDLLQRATRNLESARSELNQTREQLKEVTAERDELRNSETSLSGRTEQLQQELSRIKEVAADSLNLQQRNGELREENQKL